MPTRQQETKLLCFIFTNFEDSKKLVAVDSSESFLRVIFSMDVSEQYSSDAEDNIDEKMNLYFTYESRDTLKSLTLFIIVKLLSRN